MSVIDDAKGAASNIAQRTKLNAEILLTNRKIVTRVNAFGVEMYKHACPLTESQDFYANDDDRLVQVLRPPLLTASKDIAALQNRFEAVTGQLEEAKVKRAGAFPVPAETAGEKIKNAGKATAMTANETRLKTELAVVQRKITGIQEAFGRELYPILKSLEDKEGWLPTDRDIRSIYDQARREIDPMYRTRTEKLDLLISLGGSETGLKLRISRNDTYEQSTDGSVEVDSGFDSSYEKNQFVPPAMEDV